MTAQFDLFIAPPRVRRPPYQRDSETSRAAADHVAPRVGRLQARVLDYLRSRSDGATLQEIAEATGIKINSVCGRVSELIDKGLVVRTPLTRVNAASGCEATVLKAKAIGG